MKGHDHTSNLKTGLTSSIQNTLTQNSQTDGLRENHHGQNDHDFSRERCRFGYGRSVHFNYKYPKILFFNDRRSHKTLLHHHRRRCRRRHHQNLPIYPHPLG